tara:strand:+ start:1 stop:1506 length:1506 start_codon:yes stop_codon:yes gene_type:complete
MWDVVLSSSVTENGYDIVACVGVPTLALTLRYIDTETPERFGSTGDGDASIDTGVFLRISELANSFTIKAIETNRTYLLSQGYIISAPSFRHSGSGFIKTDPVLIISAGDGIQLAEYSGPNASVTGVLFDGQSDNTDSGDVTPTFKLVVLSGKNPHWNARTQNSGGYALDVTGKNPYIERHLDSNSMYSMVRFFPQEEWDYCRIGLVSGDRVSSVAGASGRGIIFNGVFVINQITIDQYKSKSRGILADASAGGATGVGYYKNMHIKSLVQEQLINSGAASTEGTKLENVENLTIDYCEITHAGTITDFEPLKLTDTLGFVNIGTLKIDGRVKLPTGIPVTVQQTLFSGGVVGNSIFNRSDDLNKVYWTFGSVFFDTNTAQASGKAVIEHGSEGGQIKVGQYTEANEAFNLIKVSIRQRNLFTCYEPSFTQQVSSAFIESVTQIPRQVITSNLGNLQGEFLRGDIAWDLTPSAGGTAMQICTTSGTIGVDAVMKDALTISV